MLVWKRIFSSLCERVANRVQPQCQLTFTELGPVRAHFTPEL